jgi:hypothetical protein
MLIIAVVLLMWMNWSRNQKLHRENQRLTTNLQALQLGMQEVRLSNGRLAQQSQVLNMGVEELKALFPLQYQNVLRAGLSARRTKQMSTTHLNTEHRVTTSVRDSVIRDTVRVRVFSYRDDWVNLEGIAEGDSQQVRFESRDSLVQVVYRGSRIKPWLWIFSRRQLEQRIYSSNPYSRIHYNQTIRLHHHD